MEVILRQSVPRYLLRQVLLLVCVALFAMQGVRAAGDKPTTGTPSPQLSAPPSTASPSAAPTASNSSKPILPAAEPATASPTPSASKTPQPAIIISDTDNHRILQIDDMTGKGLKALGFPGYGIAHLLRPAQVWVDYKGRIHIADKGNRRIVRIDDISGKGWVEMGGFESPEGVAVRGNELIVSDTGANKVLVYSEFGGNLTSTIMDPRLQRPAHLWLDGQGALYVSCGSDPPGGRIMKQTNRADSSKWVVFEGQGLRGAGFLPSQIITLKDCLWVTDSSSSRLVRCDDLQGHAAREFGGLGQKLGRFQNPQGLAVDQQGNLYVADTGNDRIVFVPNGDVSQWTVWSGKSKGAAGLGLRSPNSIFVWSPVPAPEDEEYDKDGKRKPKKDPKKEGGGGGGFFSGGLR